MNHRGSYAPIGIIVHACGTIRYLNETACELFGAADLSASFAALSRELKASWKSLGAREDLSAKDRERVSSGEATSLQTLINKLHQKSFRSWEKVTRSFKADGLVSSESSSFAVMNLSPAPFIDKAAATSPALRASAILFCVAQASA